MNRFSASFCSTSDKKMFSSATNLYMHLDDGFPNQSGSKKSPERNQKMTTSYSGQVEKRIRDLKQTHETILKSDD